MTGQSVARSVKAMASRKRKASSGAGGGERPSKPRSGKGGDDRKAGHDKAGHDKAGHDKAGHDKAGGGGNNGDGSSGAGGKKGGSSAGNQGGGSTDAGSNQGGASDGEHKGSWVAPAIAVGFLQGVGEEAAKSVVKYVRDACEGGFVGGLASTNLKPKDDSDSEYAPEPPEWGV